MITDKDHGGSARYMTLRDYFAAQAMQSLITRVPLSEDAEKVSESAYAIADAMIAERNK